MRNLLLIFSLFLALNVSGQTIQYDSTLSGSYVTIVPFKAQFTDELPSTRLYVVIGYDNLFSECSLTWTLRNDNGTTTAIGKVFIQDEDYLNWSGSSIYPYKMTLKKLNLTELK